MRCGLIALFGKLGRSLPFESAHFYIFSYSKTQNDPGCICKMQYYLESEKNHQFGVKVHPLRALGHFH